MFGKNAQNSMKYYTFQFDFDDPRTLRGWFILWYSFVALVFVATLYLVLINAPFNPLGILVCLLTFAAYVLNTRQVRLIYPFNNSLPWLLLYSLLLYLYINYVHPYIFFFYSLNMFIVLVSLFYRCHKLFTPTQPATNPHTDN